MTVNPNKHIENVISYFNKIADEYDKIDLNETISYDELFNYVSQHVEWYYIEKYLPKSGIVLDAAGGTGRLAIPIALKGLKVVIIDISDGMLRVAREKVRKHKLEDRIIIKRGDIHNIDFPDNYFDFILAMGIEYCYDLEKVISELSRVLKKNSYLMFSVDSLFFVVWAYLNMKDLDGALKVIEERKYIDEDDVYCWTFTPSELRKICERNNLRVEKIVGRGICAYIKDPNYRKEIFRDKKKLEKILEIELRLSEIEDFAVIDNHPIVIAKKL